MRTDSLYEMICVMHTYMHIGMLYVYIIRVYMSVYNCRLGSDNNLNP